MNQGKLHIYEEETNLFWGLIIVVCTAGATFLLADSFVTVSWQFTGFSKLFALLLFVISFIGIFKLAEPLYHFVFSIEKQSLAIEVMKGTQTVKTIKLPLQQIEALKFAPYSPRLPGEALFDFSKNFHLMWKPAGESRYKKLIDISPESFTLKVEDIVKIIRFIRRHKTDIGIPEQQIAVFGL